ncbi:MAG: DUF2393 domain-containing protein [Epsilonproteobacteria bacterium]|nr:DUF2393 domain-containing protein [Campylobacterota bacterium]
MKEKILLFLHTFTVYDYIYFGSVFILFILFIVLTLLLREKITLALFMLLIALLDITLGPTLGYNYFHSTLYKNEITITKAKKLTFVKAVIIEGNLKNTSKFNFKECKIEASILRDTHNKYKNLILKLKPIKTDILIVKDIPKGKSTEFKFLIEPFNYQKDFNVSVTGICR